MRGQRSTSHIAIDSEYERFIVVTSGKVLGGFERILAKGASDAGRRCMSELAMLIAADAERDR